jgi:hypothetical protein
MFNEYTCITIEHANHVNVKVYIIIDQIMTRERESFTATRGISSNVYSKQEESAVMFTLNKQYNIQISRPKRVILRSANFTSTSSSIFLFRFEF